MSLKELTKASHDLVESKPFVKMIFAGEINPTLYATYLYNQFQMYDMLETHATMAGLLNDLPNIRRAPRIHEDFYELWPKGDAPPVELPVTTAYKEHLVTIREDKEKLMAHLYVRHMGDLYGGQMIAQKVPGQGNYYKFENASELKATIREKLNDDMADEANVCFEFAARLFDELHDSISIPLVND
jgi:heme oxygenase